MKFLFALHSTIVAFWLSVSLSVYSAQENTPASSANSPPTSAEKLLLQRAKEQQRSQLIELEQLFPSRNKNWLNEEKTSLGLTFPANSKQTYGDLFLIIEQLEHFAVTNPFVEEMNRLGWQVHYVLMPPSLIAQQNNPTQSAETFLNTLLSALNKLPKANSTQPFLMTFDSTVLRFFKPYEVTLANAQAYSNLNNQVSGIIHLVDDLSPEAMMQLTNSELHLLDTRGRIIFSNKIYDRLASQLTRILPSNSFSMDRFNDTFFSLNNATFTSQKLHGWMKARTIKQAK